MSPTLSTITIRADLDPLVPLTMIYGLIYGPDAEPDDPEYAMSAIAHLLDKIVTGTPDAL